MDVVKARKHNQSPTTETGKLYKDREKMRSLILGGLAEARKLSRQPAVVMGYCFGGAVALEMARSDMAGMANGYATFHGGLSTPEGQGWDGDEPPVMVFHGGADISMTVRYLNATRNLPVDKSVFKPQWPKGTKKVKK